MKELPKTIKHDGIELYQIMRTKNAAIYKEKKYNSYEVVVIRSHKGFIIKDKVVEAAEYYPKSNDWGKFGWTYTNLPDAKVRYASLNAVS